MSHKTNQHIVSVIECPVCGKELNAARSFSSEEPDRQPEENDISVCGYCSTVMVFQKDLKARVIKDQEFEFIKQHNPELFEELNKTIDRIMRNNGKLSDLFNS